MAKKPRKKGPKVVSLFGAKLGREIAPVMAEFENKKERLAWMLVNEGFSPQYADMAAGDMAEDWINDTVDVPIWFKVIEDFTQKE